MGGGIESSVQSLETVNRSYMLCFHREHMRGPLSRSGV